MQNVIILPAGFSDLKSIQAIGRQTFYETFVDSNSAEDMQKYLDENFSDERLSKELKNPDSLFFLASSGDKLVGYLKLNKGEAQSEKLDGNGLEIERIYVSTEFQGKEVGKLLFEKALEVAKAENSDFVWLGVWEENKKAITFYERNGFIVFGKHDFVLGKDVQTDLLMKLSLKS